MGTFTKDLVRIDKNISYHYLYFKKYSQDDGKLMFMLLVYFAKQHQHDLFGSGTLDPMKFCKEYNLSPQNYIWAKHPHPRQLQESSIEELEAENIPVFDTVFENSLYCLYADIFQFPKGKFYYSKFAKYKAGEGIESIQFVTSLTKRFVKVGKTQKRVYDYELSPKYIANLSFLFFNVNIDSLKISTRKNNDGLYLYIKNCLNEMRGKNLNSLELKFNDVRSLLDINSDNSVYVKRKIKKAFTEIILLQDIKNKGVSFTWFKIPGQKYEYGILLNLVGGADKERNMVKTEESWVDVKGNLLRTLLLDSFKRRYPEAHFMPKEELKFKYIKWLQDEKADPDSKMTSYIDYFKSTNTQKMSEKLSWLVDGFPEKLSKEYMKYI